LLYCEPESGALFPQGQLGDVTMVRTITVGNYVSIQGLFVRSLADGRIVVRVGREEYIGRPVSSAPLAA